MPRWLLVVTVALSLTALLLIVNLPDSGSDSNNFKLNFEMPSVEHYVWMGCPAHGRSARPSSSLGTSPRHATTLAAMRATGRSVASAWSPFSPY